LKFVRLKAFGHTGLNMHNSGVVHV